MWPHYLMSGNNNNVKDQFTGCGQDCYEQPANPTQQGQDEISQDYILISGGRFVNEDLKQRQIKFNELYCGNKLPGGDLGVRVETPGPSVVRSVTSPSSL